MNDPFEDCPSPDPRRVTHLIWAYDNDTPCGEPHVDVHEGEDLEEVLALHREKYPHLHFEVEEKQ